jgi:MFS family permease
MGCTGLGFLRFIAANSRFLGFGVLLAGLSCFGQTFVLSLFGGQLREAFDLSNAGFGLTYSLATLASGVSLIWAGRLADSVDLRKLTAMVVIGAAAGCLLLAGSRGVVMLALAFFLLRFSGQGLMVHTAQTAMARYFQHDRGKAVSTATLGLPVAEGMMPGVMVGAAAVLGWRSTWVASALLLVAIMLPLLLVLLRGHGERHAAHRREAAAAGVAEGSWERREVLRHGPFYGLLPAVLGPPFIITALFFHQVPLAAEKGWSLEWLATSFVAFAGAHVLSLFFAGPVVDAVGARRLVPVYLLPMVAALLTLATGSGDWLAPAYLGLAGLSVGVGGTLMGALWAELYGSAHLGAIRAMVQSAMVLVTAVAPVLVGVLLDAGLTMSLIAAALAGYALLASALAAVSARPTVARAG